MCGIAGYSVSTESQIDRTLATQALLAGIATPRYSALSLVFPVVILLGLAAFNPKLEPGVTEAGGEAGKPGRR